MSRFAATIAWLQLRAQGARAMADQERARDDGNDVVARACDEAADDAIYAIRVLLDHEGATCSKS